MKRLIVGALAATCFAGCVDSDPAVDEDGDGDPDNDCPFHVCGDGGGGSVPPPSPALFVIERDVSAVRPPGELANGGRWRQRITSVDPAGGTPVVTVHTSPNRATAEITIVSSDATSVTVDVTGTSTGPLVLAIENAVAREEQLVSVFDVVDVRLVVPGTFDWTSASKIYRGEPRVFVDLCRTDCKYGEARLIDASLEETSGSPLVQTAWDTFALPVAPGRYPLTFEATGVPAESIALEIVDAVDSIAVEPFSGGPADNLPTTGTLCFHGVAGHDRIMSSNWSATAEVLWLTPTNYTNCVSYKASANSTYSLDVTGMGRTQRLKITTAP